MDTNTKGSVTPQKVKKILAKHGNEVTLEEAEIILTFLTTLAEISVAQVKFDQSNPVVCPQ